MPRAATRTPTPSNVLCLGMSYACVRQQLENEGVAWEKIIHKSPSVDQTVELVRRNVLTQMDGRDLARCISMESSLNTKAYTVSQERGALYADNHLNGNFNRRIFLREIKRHWGEKICFRQIILDYFWIPQGSWVMNHWGRSFFHSTLPGFVQEGLLEFETRHAFKPKNVPTGIAVGVVYLPFCFHCVKQIVASIKILSEYYTISFVYTKELQEHALWAGTSKICPQTMQEWLGKQLNQEDVYCTFKPRDVKGCIEDAHVTKEEVVDVLRRIEDFGDVRMIRLKPLQKHNPNRRKKRSCRLQVPENKIGVDLGGFVGLKHPDEVKRGYYDMETDESSTAKTETGSELSECEQEEKATKSSKSPDKSKKAPKKSVRLELVELSSEEKPAEDSEESLDCDDPYRLVDESVIQVSRKNGRSKTYTVINLCPELHPFEPDFDPEREKSSGNEDDLGFNLLLEAADMVHEAEQSHNAVHILSRKMPTDLSSFLTGSTGGHAGKRKTGGGACTAKRTSRSPKNTSGAKCENVEGVLLWSPDAKGKNAGEASSMPSAAPSAVKRSSDGTPLSPPCRSARRTDSTNATDTSNSYLSNDETTNLRRRCCPSSGNSSVKKPAILNNSSARVLHQELGNILQNETTQDYSGLPSSRVEIPESHHDQLRGDLGLAYHLFNQYVPEENPNVMDLDNVMQGGPHHPLLPYGVASLPLNGIQLSRNDLIIPNGGALFAQLLQNARSNNVTVCLADEDYTGNKTCCNAVIQSCFNPKFSVAELTRFLVEEVNPLKWLTRICNRSGRDAVPNIVRISYGNALVTEVHVAHPDVDETRQVSVGLRLQTPLRGPILSPLDSVTTHLHPGLNCQPHVELVTSCVDWISTAEPSHILELDKCATDT